MKVLDVSSLDNGINSTKASNKPNNQQTKPWTSSMNSTINKLSRSQP
ncbi:hypothetical protein [Sutcliffiella horikoshii]|nr:hypothetical protein [Sutcliffiella horikoshii]